MPIPPSVHDIVADIARKIDRGEYPPGMRLPSGRELADRYDVSLSTIQRAVKTLRESGALVGRQGRAVYVAE